MKTALFGVLVLALLCQSALCKKNGEGDKGKGKKNTPRGLDKAIGGRNSQSDENGGIRLEGRKKACSLRVMAISELNSSGQEINGSRSEERVNITNKEMTSEDLPFSKVLNGTAKIPAKCLTVTQEMSGTEVDLKCCVPTEDGTITLGDTSPEEVTVKKGYMKCSITLKQHDFDALADKVCIETEVTPPGKGKSQKCATNPGNSGGNSNRKLPKSCDLGDGATMQLSTMAAEIPAGGSLDNPVWVELDENDVGLTVVDGKVVSKFCVPKGSVGTDKWYDPTVGLEDEDYTGSAAHIFMSLTTIIASLLATLLI